MLGGSGNSSLSDGTTICPYFVGEGEVGADDVRWEVDWSLDVKLFVAGNGSNSPERGDFTKEERCPAYMRLGVECVVSKDIDNRVVGSGRGWGFV